MISIKSKVNLLPYLTMKIDCIAKKFCICETKEEIIEAIKYSYKNNLQFILLGGGSNVVPENRNVQGLVAINRYRLFEKEKEINNNILFRISSGFPMSLLVRKTVELGFSGFEHHFGLPGTLGGAITMNSKWGKVLSYVSDPLVKAILVDRKGVLKEVSKEYFKFSYDYSILQDTGEIFLEGLFYLKKEITNNLIKKMKEAHTYRLSTQPVGVFTSGCYFKNITEEKRLSAGIKHVSAGYIIDSLGLKGYKIGGFFVSDKHANFIINDGSGTLEDLTKLRTLIKEKVLEKYNINLEEEVHSI